MAKDEVGLNQTAPAIRSQGGWRLSDFGDFLRLGPGAGTARLNGTLQSLYIERRPAGAAAAFGAARLPFGREGQPQPPAQIEGGSGKKGNDNEQLNVHDTVETSGARGKFASRRAIYDLYSAFQWRFSTACIWSCTWPLVARVSRLKTGSPSASHCVTRPPASRTSRMPAATS